MRAREVLSGVEDSPERQEAIGSLADRLDLPRETLSGIAPARGQRAARPAQPKKLLDAGLRLEREALAAVVAHPELHDSLAGLAEEHFDLDEHRRMRASLVAGTPPTPISSACSRSSTRPPRARASRGRTGTEMLLRLRERKLRRDLQGETDLARATELQAHLAKVRQALTELA